MALATTLRWTAERHPDRTAVSGTGRHLTYRQREVRVNRLARALRASGVGPGDRVALSVTGGQPLASLHLAAQVVGAVSVPLFTRFAVEELAYSLHDARAALVVTDDSQAERTTAAAGVVPVRTTAEFDAVAERESDTVPGAPPSEEDLSVMLYTSGTTGRPKGVPRTHRAERAAAIAHAVQTQQRQGERVLGVMPNVPYDGSAYAAVLDRGRRHLGRAGDVRCGTDARADRGRGRLVALPGADDVLVPAARERTGAGGGPGPAGQRRCGDDPGAG